MTAAGIASAGEIARYDLNEGTGTVAGDTGNNGNGYDATSVDGTSTTWIVGGVTFSDDDQRLFVDIAPDSCWVLGAGAGNYNEDLMDDCMEAWEVRVRPTAYDEAGSLYINSATHFWGRFNGDSGIVAGWSDEAYRCPELNGGGPPSGINKWVTIKASYDGRKLVSGREGVGEAKLWVDGVLKSTVTFDTSDSAYPDGLRMTRAGCGTILNVGGTGHPMQAFIGDMDYAVLWDVPEPATISLLAFGGLALLRRRKA